MILPLLMIFGFAMAANASAAASANIVFVMTNDPDYNHPARRGAAKLKPADKNGLARESMRFTDARRRRP